MFQSKLLPPTSHDSETYMECSPKTLVISNMTAVPCPWTLVMSYMTAVLHPWGIKLHSCSTTSLNIGNKLHDRSTTSLNTENELHDCSTTSLNTGNELHDCSTMSLNLKSQWGTNFMHSEWHIFEINKGKGESGTHVRQYRWFTVRTTEPSEHLQTT